MCSAAFASSAATSSASAAVGRGGDHLDRLAQRRVLDAEGHAFADQPGGVQHLFHLGRADAVARGLDHLVAPADEVQEALGVAAHRVAREHRVLGQLQAARRRPRQQLVALGRLLGIVPVAHGRPARRGAPARRARRRPHSLPSSRSTRISALGIALPMRIGPAVHLLRRQVGASGRPRSGRTSGRAWPWARAGAAASSVSRGMRPPVLAK